MKIFFGKPNFYTYLTGFLFSVVLTIAAFVLTQKHLDSNHLFISHSFIIPVLLGLAFLQLIVQLVFFLHVLNEKRPKWNLLFFIGTFGLVLMVVVASMIIMNNLKHYHMSSESASEYIIIDEGIRVNGPNHHHEANH